MIAVFAGTSEGRRTVSLLLEGGIKTAVFAATEYGGEILRRECPGAEVFTGRLSAEEMRERFRRMKVAAVIDATHPYAAEVSENIRRACTGASPDCGNIPLIRVSRPQEEIPENARLFPTIADIAAELCKTDKTALITTGAKSLAEYTAVSGYRDRLWIRLLPLAENITKAAELGFARSRIIAMQGPFTKEVEAAFLHFSGAGILVTKASGKEGGFGEKAAAAAAVGAELFVLSPPQDSGASPEEAVLWAAEKEGIR